VYSWPQPPMTSRGPVGEYLICSKRRKRMENDGRGTPGEVSSRKLLSY
jgi:hypothetical protein